MAGSTHHDGVHLSDRGIAFWLPPGGWGNGLADDAWAEIIDLTSEFAADLILRELKDAGVPGYAARVRQPHHQDLRWGRPHSVLVRIWVGCSAYGRAEDTLLRIVPQLVKSSSSQIIG